MDFNSLANDIASLDIKTVFGIPGSGATLSLIDALEKKDIGFCLTHFEGTAVLIAATIGRLSGKAGISLSIKGPGLVNSLPGLATAWFESFPVVHLAEAFSPETPLSQAHKRLDHTSLVSAVTKGLRNICQTGPNLMEMASWAEAELPGPAVMELVTSKEPNIPIPFFPATTGNAEKITALISRSQKPIVIAGSLAIRNGWTGYLAALDIPVFSTAAAKGIIDETLSHSAGVYTGVGGKLTPEYNMISNADLVVGIGLNPREVLKVKPFQCKAVLIESIKIPGSDGFAFSCYAGVDAIKPAIDALKQKTWGIEELSAVKNRLKSHLDDSFLPAQVFQLIDDHFKGNVRAVMDTGYFCTIGEHIWLARKSDGCLLSGCGRYMGAGLPMAIGASMFDKSIPTIAFIGDGGIGMYLAEARIAVRNCLPLLIVLMTDNAFGSIRTRAINEGFTQNPLIMDGKSWSGIFNSMDISSIRTENLKQVGMALSSWKPGSGPLFLEIPFDLELYEAMVKGIR